MKTPTTAKRSRRITRRANCRLSYYENTETAKATARRLRLFSALAARLRSEHGVRSAWACKQDGKHHVAIAACAGYANPCENRWMEFSVTPATAENWERLYSTVEAMLVKAATVATEDE